MKKIIIVIIHFSLFFHPLSKIWGAVPKDTITVALDGSADFVSIQEAVTACGAFPSATKTIFVKNGIYKEKIIIDSFNSNICLVGENKDQTIISFNNYNGQPSIGTFTSYTLKILADNVSLENITVENTAGAVGQAVALHVEGDYFKAYNCKILGNQDTLYTAGENRRHYFSNCYIEGTTDFIFGSATAVFHMCTLYSKANSYITAANTSKNSSYGFVFLKCKLLAAPGVHKVYLGRPWREYANVIFSGCFMDAHIRPEGWHNWGKPSNEKTAYYAEFNNYGPGAVRSRRVAWSHFLSAEVNSKLSFNTIFKIENQWLPAASAL
ncbi:pectinesterase family protein [Flavobacterium aquidurense]|uniref:pectinesterase family protein n=1 Tax=Flavobacterium aquidurense TaxID=362413 RepID=UPI002859F65C|nr:pectinesterase family protein [Flavobacterium aquidurense]MDR7370291.1 pectinesterase [Flavobacterium aquidurense]